MDLVEEAGPFVLVMAHLIVPMGIKVTTAT